VFCLAILKYVKQELMFTEAIDMRLTESSTSLPRRFLFSRNGFGCGPGFIIAVFNNLLKGKYCLRDGF